MKLSKVMLLSGPLVTIGEYVCWSRLGCIELMPSCKRLVSCMRQVAVFAGLLRRLMLSLIHSRD